MSEKLEETFFLIFRDSPPNNLYQKQKNKIFFFLFYLKWSRLNQKSEKKAGGVMMMMGEIKSQREKEICERDKRFLFQISESVPKAPIFLFLRFQIAAAEPN